LQTAAAYLPRLLQQVLTGLWVAHRANSEPGTHPAKLLSVSREQQLSFSSAAHTHVVQMAWQLSVAVVAAAAFTPRRARECMASESSLGFHTRVSDDPVEASAVHTKARASRQKHTACLVDTHCLENMVCFQEGVIGTGAAGPAPSDLMRSLVVSRNALFVVGL